MRPAWRTHRRARCTDSCGGRRVSLNYLTAMDSTFGMDGLTQLYVVCKVVVVVVVGLECFR